MRLNRGCNCSLKSCICSGRTSVPHTDLLCKNTLEMKRNNGLICIGIFKDRVIILNCFNDKEEKQREYRNHLQKKMVGYQFFWFFSFVKFVSSWRHLVECLQLLLLKSAFNQQQTTILQSKIRKNSIISVNLVTKIVNKVRKWPAKLRSCLSTLKWSTTRIPQTGTRKKLNTRPCFSTLKWLTTRVNS